MEVVMAKQARFKLLQTLLFATFLISVCSGAGPEQGIFTKTVAIRPTVTEDKKDVDDVYVAYEGFSKSMYAKSEVALSVEANSCEENDKATFTVSWMIRYSECEISYTVGNNSQDYSGYIFDNPSVSLTGETKVFYYISEMPTTMRCSDDHTFGSVMDDERDGKWTEIKVSNSPQVAPEAPKNEGDKEQPVEGDGKATRRKRRQAGEAEGGKMDPEGKKADPEVPANQEDSETNPFKPETKPNDPETKPKDTETKPTTKKTNPATTKTNPTTKPSPKTLVKHPVTKAPLDGRYFFIVKIESTNIAKPMSLELKVEMRSEKGYLSAYQWPLLPFFGVMCAVYSVLAFVWLLLLGCNWRDLLRIQFWICGVLILGLLEKAIFYAEYEHVSKYGESVTGAIIFAELISCLKRALARMLLIIVSLGYGITRPRLGRDLHWVMAAGTAYFVLSSVEGCLRVKGNEQHALIAVLPLAVLDAVICWWIFKNLVDTTRQLRLRRNLTKLWLYRHLTNTLIVCIISAVVFLVWSTKAHRWTACVTKWRELWLDDAYWHLLFCIILTVVMVLVRPTANNQRYAFSPLVDAADDEESQQPMINDAFDSVKMRQMPGEKSNSNKSAAEDALKWVEDNIPAAVADAALGAFDDSEEELVNTLERNKME